jgi:hypothetical protein
VVGRRGENFGAKKGWKKKIHEGREDGIFVHPQNGFNGLILNWRIGGCWFTPANWQQQITHAPVPLAMER